MVGNPAHHARNLRQGALTLALAGIAGLLTACTDGRSIPGFPVRTGGVAERGEHVIIEKNCGSCHTIPGITGARGAVGPPLYFLSRRTMIAGQLPNTPDNLIHWIRDPQSVVPGNAMPNLGLTDGQARDVAAYLETLR